jgi:hypothetical protein
MKIERKSVKALDPLAKWCQRTQGGMALVLRELNRRTGEPQFRSNLQLWLHEDPAKRTQPRLGLGLALLEIWADIKARKVQVAA